MPETHHRTEDVSIGRPAKKVKLLDEEESSGDEDAGVSLDGIDFRINEEYARRFEHNKKRAELHKLEEKYGKDVKLGEEMKSEDSSSDDESEDDDGILVTEGLDDEISATLKAIRSRDPKVYDENSKFYSEFNPNDDQEANEEQMEKPMYLKDYHRKNLLENGTLDLEQEVDGPLPYALEQAALKKSIIKEMHASTDVDDGEADSDQDESFLVRVKAASPPPSTKPSIPDPTTADQDPETYISNFLASRAWVPTAKSRFQPLESDDDDEDDRAEEFEAAYNLRFEDPETSNQKLMTHSREVTSKYSVRREEASSRKRVREMERAKKEAEKSKRHEDRARLKTLKMQEMEDKVNKIREAAGISGKTIKIEEWADILEGEWDDDKWDSEMKSRFGEDYYDKDGDISIEDEEDDDDDGLGERNGTKGRKKSKKPKWKDDIHIKDLVPEFDEGDQADFSLTEDEDKDEVEDGQRAQKSLAEARAEAKADSRRDRRIIEALVDQSLPLDAGSSGSAAPVAFRYRETSPVTFGLTALDILAADDTQLNQFVGLKKLASFRDPGRKRKDRKTLSKKARLREWRKDVFGREDGPAPETIFASSEAAESQVMETEDAVKNLQKKKSKKRRRKGKGKEEV